jgi:hypothetical protein
LLSWKQSVHLADRPTRANAEEKLNAGLHFKQALQSMMAREWPKAPCCCRIFLVILSQAQHRSGEHTWSRLLLGKNKEPILKVVPLSKELILATKEKLKKQNHFRNNLNIWQSFNLRLPLLAFSDPTYEAECIDLRLAGQASQPLYNLKQQKPHTNFLD